MSDQQHLKFLMWLVNLREPKAEKHGLDVEHYSVLIGRQIGLSAVELKRLRFAARIHDIGKIGVNELVLNKPTTLTEAEMSMMKHHTNYGHDIATYLGLSCAQIILYHHENWDGSGYHHLEGDAIPLEARIIRIADCYSAMISHRIYRPALSVNETISLMKAMPYFDPEILDVFFKMRV